MKRGSAEGVMVVTEHNPGGWTWVPGDDAARAWAATMTSHSRVPLQWGPTDVDRYLGDPKRIAFFMARYEFAAKMLARCDSIIDVGCGSGMGTLTFLNDTQATKVLGIDFEQEVIDHAVDHLLAAAAKVREDIHRLEFAQCDFLNSPYCRFSGLCCLDVIEHIDPSQAGACIAEMVTALTADGVAVIGTPSLASAPFASKHSQIGHINLYEPERLRQSLEAQFRHVFMFSMNHAVVHAGVDPLARYLIAVCVK